MCKFPSSPQIIRSRAPHIEKTRHQDQLENLVGVLILSLGELVIKRLLVVGSILGTDWHRVNDTESNGVDNTLQGAEDSSNGLSEGGQAKNTVLANDSGQETLVNLNELQIC